MSRLDFNINDLAREENLLTKVKFYFSYKQADEWYNPEEGHDSLESVNLNPITVKMYVSEISPEKLYYKMQGTHSESGKLILCDKKYKKYFQNAAKIEIDGKEYSTYNKATGSNLTIANRPKNNITVTIYAK